ncbi:C40 family peptidase [Paenibacillus sp. PDC88]|uniref:C40 family peptidase n=1 Tax=Paenibacillus provencensis TaxID=441151 RepID=A0ABW3Q781_9BACL|nr:C40 family peptidase [Paenibacillus sp. PDC88]SDX61692.1 NlpC/P60 family protein [Paenibacillus sp. PDC88]
MKKIIMSLLGSVIIISSGTTSAFADDKSKLQSEVSQVVGTPYKWGGTTAASGFDCSGFILYIFDKFNQNLPRTSAAQAKTGTAVAKSNLRTGDLVFFNTSGKGISHAGIYIGDGQFAHSSSSKGVRVSKLSETYYKQRYVTARRTIDDKSFSNMVDDSH